VSVTGAADAATDNLKSDRRARVLSAHLARLIPPQSKVLDVGCGDGQIDQRILEQLPEARIEGIDRAVAPGAPLCVQSFDGIHFPYPDASFDVVMFVDVLHETDDPLLSLQEARRVGKMILIKDFVQEGFMARATLGWLDRRAHTQPGVVVPYNYWPRAQWEAAFDAVGLKHIETLHSLGLYAPPASWIFERRLHFIARLERDDP
jgi:SAM-dependent methyltransferase